MKYASLLLVLLIAASAAAQEARRAKFTSPRETLKTLLSSLKEGQIERVPDCFVEPQSEDERNMLLYGMSDDSFSPAVHKALVEKFGEQGSPLGRTLLSFEQQLQVVDSMEETTDGINGRLAVKGQDKGGIAFVRVKNDWKLVIAPSAMLRPIPPNRLASAQALRGAYVDTIEEISNDKFASADDAIKALEARRRAAADAR